jgi:tellurite resistance protein
MRAWQTEPAPAQSAPKPGWEGEGVPERATNLRADLILKAMIAVGSADGGLEDREVSLIQQVYADQADRPITRQEITEVSQASTRDSLLAELSAAAPALDRETTEEIIRAAYLTLLADDRIAAEERKKLKDIAMALRVSEIHFGAILEDLAMWLEEEKAK